MQWTGLDCCVGTVMIVWLFMYMCVPCSGFAFPFFVYNYYVDKLWEVVVQVSLSLSVCI